MKYITFLILALFSFTSVVAQPEVNTKGDNSPAVIAKNFSTTYGVRPDAIEAILWVYNEQGYDVERRKKATEQILTKFAQSPERKQKNTELSVASLDKMGITNAPKIINALEWDLFAQKYYLSTTGQNSPSVIAKGDVNIWYGIPPKALRALANQLEKNKTDISNFEIKLGDQVKKYAELKTELETYSSKEVIYQKAEALLEEGKLEEADKLISFDFSTSMKRQGYRGYIFGKTKELNLQYDSAAIGFKNAIDNDQRNANYHFHYADNERTLARYDEAIKHYQIALDIDTINKTTLLNNLGLAGASKGEYNKAIRYYEKSLEIDKASFGARHPIVATDYNNLGEVWYSKGDYDKAIGYLEKSLEINRASFGERHPNVARNYNNLGGVWDSKGDYNRAIGYYEKSLEINRTTLGELHPNVAIDYNNIGEAWRAKGEYDKAIGYYEKSLEINKASFGERHPNIAIDYNNFGGAWDSKGEYDKAIGYYEKSLEIDRASFGERHPNVARDYNNLGGAWDSKGDYGKAIGYYEKSQLIFQQFFGPNHPNLKTVAENLSNVANKKGMELYPDEEYDKALPYFQKALKNAEIAKNIAFLLTCLNNIGSTHKHLKNYEQGLLNLDLGIQKAVQLNQEIDQQIKKELTPEMLKKPEVQKEIAERKNFPLIRRMQYHKVGCLKGLKRDKEAETLAKQLWQEGIETNDKPLIDDLIKDGYDFGKK
jgi:tetratricopeptide (TPR) repeat protein